MSKIGPCVGDEGCLYGREWEDSPGPEVQALFEGGGHQVGRGYGGEGGIGPTLVSYLREIWASGAVVIAGAARAAAAAVAGATTVGGEEGLTRGL